MRPDIETSVETRPRRRRLTVASVAAFQAVVEERLRNFEEQLDDVKGRVNGLFLLIAGTVLAQVLLRLFA